MVCAKDPENINIKMVDEVLKQFSKFKYLGSILTEAGKNKDIIQLVKEAKVMFNNKKQPLCSINLILEIKDTYKKLYFECCSLWIRNMKP